MVQITIQIDGDKVAINQSAAPTKVENTTKKYFVVMGTYDTHSYIELVTEDYSEAINKLKELKSSNNNSCFYTLHIQKDGEVYLAM